MYPFDAASVVLWGEDSNDLAAIGAILRRLGAATREVQSVAELEQMVQDKSVDLVIVAVHPKFRVALELLTQIRHRDKQPPVLVATDMMDVNLYLEAIQLGAFDGVGLPPNEGELARIAGRAITAHRARQAVSRD